MAGYYACGAFILFGEFAQKVVEVSFTFFSALI